MLATHVDTLTHTRCPHSTVKRTVAAGRKMKQRTIAGVADRSEAYELCAYYHNLSPKVQQLCTTRARSQTTHITDHHHTTTCLQLMLHHTQEATHPRNTDKQKTCKKQHTQATHPRNYLKSLYRPRSPDSRASFAHALHLHPTSSFRLPSKLAHWLLVSVRVCLAMPFFTLHYTAYLPAGFVSVLVQAVVIFTGNKRATGWMVLTGAARQRTNRAT